MFRRSQRDFEAEIESHILIETDRLIEEGMPPSEARLAARRKFGSVATAQERYHDTSRTIWLEQLLQDVRYAARMLRKSPGFTLVATMTLALGIGANTAVFSVVHGVLLSGLPYREPERLVTVWENLPGVPRIMVSYPDYKDWKARTRVFDDIALYSPFPSMARGDGSLPEQLNVGWATGNLTRVLGVSPLVGRAFLPDDDRPGSAHVAMLSAGYWRRAFAANPGVIGRMLTLDGERYKIVGVMPELVGLGAASLWIPMGPMENTPFFNRGNHPGLIGLGRLKPGVTIEQMSEDLARVSRQIVAENPKDAAGISAGGDFFRERLVHNIRPTLKLLAWAVVFVLLIACVNVANLLLARSMGRRREIALRLAIGASDGRVMRLLVTENLLLALVGGVLGIGLAYTGVRALVAMQPVGVPRLVEIHMSIPVLVFATVISIATGLVFGLVPARQAARVDLSDSLKETGRGTSATRAALRVRSLLMIVEVAAALMLLVGAGLLLRSMARLARVDVGVDPSGIATAGINLPDKTYPDDKAQRTAMREILHRVQAVPGVASAALTSALPLSANMQEKMTFEGHARPKGDEPLMNVQSVSPEYFKTVGMRVVRGRGFAATDGHDGAHVVWIDETVASTYFPNEDPVGKRLVHGAFDSEEAPMVVAGVVNDVKDQGVDERASGTLYVPFEQQPQNWMTLVLKTSIPLAQVMPAVRRAVASFDKQLPLANERLLDDVVARSFGQERFTMFVLGIFALVALLLAAVGVYGVIAYFVAQRLHEIGIRMALGASGARIVSLVAGRVLTSTGAGVAIGLIGAVAASGVMRNFLYEVAPTDVTTYAAGALLLLVVASIAAIVPTMRGTRVNPVSAMKSD